MAKKVAKPSKEVEKKPKAAAKAKVKAEPKESKKAKSEDVDLDDAEEAAVEGSVEAAEKPAKAEKKKKTPAPKKEKPLSKRAAAAALEITQERQKWFDLNEKHAGTKAPVYSMSGEFTSNSPLQHKVLGWGYVLTNNNDRLEVLFETGTKILISNYKA